MKHNQGQALEIERPQYTRTQVPHGGASAERRNKPRRHDLRLREDAAKRKVRAILIAGDDPGSPGSPTPGAMESLHVIEQYIGAQFAYADTKIERLSNSPTKQQVMKVFEAMKQIVKREELFVVMFAGHGKEADGAQGVQSWSLANGELFTDVDLATTLLAFATSVDIVVISNCCYGEGAFRAGNHFGHRLHAAWEKAPRNSPMVCISAASPVDEVTLTKLVELASDTVAAASAKQSYNQLSSAFSAKRMVGREFHVDARPATRIMEFVLNSSAAKQPSGIELRGRRRSRKPSTRADRL